jgi:hypothetical protein
MYSEFSHDPKVQMMTEAMQRRYIMILCMRCSNSLVTLHETEVAFHLRISNEELAETKALFIQKGFIDSEWNLLNWEKRQFASDTSRARVAKHRALHKAKQEPECNVTEPLLKQKSNALDTDTDTDKEPNGSVASKLPTCPVDLIAKAYHEILPELPDVRLMDDGRKKAIKDRWKWVLTTTKPDGTRRAETKEQATEWFRSYFERARDNDFLMGRTPRTNGHTNWKCDIDFLMTTKGLKQVIEKTEDAA